MDSVHEFSVRERFQDHRSEDMIIGIPDFVLGHIDLCNNGL